MNDADQFSGSAETGLNIKGCLPLMRTPGNCIFIILLFCFSVSHGEHRDYQFNHISIDDGLSNNTVISIIRDHVGFMWFGTHEGLTRFDGHEYIHYLHDREDPWTISNNKIYNILEDRDGNIWVCTSSGLNLYLRETDKFARYMHDPGDPVSLSNNIVRIAYEDKSGTLWIGTIGGGLNRYDSESGQFIRYSFPDRSVSSVLEDRHGNLWVGTSAPGLFLLDRDNDEYSYHPFPHDVRGLKPNTGKTLYEDRHGNMWVCTEGAGLYLFDTDEKIFTRHFFNDGKGSINSNIISDIFLDDDDVLWIATDGGGINLMDTETGRISYITHSFQDSRSLSSNGIYSFYLDHEGIIWSGTFGEGINIMSPDQQEFRFFTQRGPESSSLSHKSVLSFGEDRNGNIWIGTGEGGLNKFNPESGRFTSYMHDATNPHSISSNTVTSVTEDSGGNLWVATFAGGLNRFDPENERFLRYVYEPGDTNSIGDNNIWKLLEDSDGNLWIGTLSGLEILCHENNGFKKIPATMRNGNQFPTRILSLFEDSGGNIWVGSKGPGLLDKNSMSYSFIDEGIADEMNLWEYDIRDFYEDKLGNIWIASEGGGLYRYDPVSRQLSNYTRRDGLPNDAIHQIIPDETGNLWLSTNRGISCFNPGKGTFRNYDASDGLQGNLFNYSASLLSSSGEIYFGGVNGFNMFHPEKIRKNRPPPKVFLTGLALFNRPVEIGAEDSPLSVHISQTREIELPYRSVFTFRFTAINSMPNQNNQFRYKLDGFDDWNEVGSQRMATYTNIGPGRYVFRVMAAGNDGAWNDEEASVTVVILPPFWRTIWAYAIYVIIFSSLLYFIIRYVLNRQKYKHDLMIKDMERKKIEEMNQVKLRFFTDIAHEFRTPLTLILGPLDKIMTSQADIEPYLKKHLNMMGRNAGRLLRLINELMEFRKIEMGKIRLSLVKADLVGFLFEVKSAFDEHARQHNIRYIFSSGTEVLETWIDKDKVEKIVYNILANSFKFTNDGGEVKIELQHVQRKNHGNKDDYDFAHAEIIISDTGIGISEKDLPRIFDRFHQVKNKNNPVKSAGLSGTGIGLALAKELIDFHKGDISVYSRPGEGTTFRVILPLEREYLDPDLVDVQDQDDHVHQYSFGVYGTQDNETISEVLSNKGVYQKSGDERKPALLFVEDNPDMRSYIRNSLDGCYRISEAVNGAEGLVKANDLMPDVIVSDVMMPEMDGIEMCKKIKNNINTSHIPVILLTARFSDDSTIEGFDAGADDYIPKPFNPRVLHSRIGSILEVRQRLREKFRREGILQPDEVSVTSADELFLQKAMEVVEKHIEDPSFRVSVFVSEMAISRSVLYRKFEALTGQSVNEFVRNTRLKRAAQLLALNEFNVSEITYQVGFSDPQYFSKCFSRYYGMTPSRYAKKHSVKVTRDTDSGLSL